MAFLKPHFEYDVFVSYSHGARASETETPLKDWTLELIRRLETDIRFVDNEFESLHIWRDEAIDPTIHLTDELRAKAKQAAILVIVMSPPYLASAWCKDEREWFSEQEDHSREHGRVFVVRAIRTTEANWPDFLRDQRGNALPGFPFHDAKDPMPFGWRGSREKYEDYVRQLGQLRTALIARLRELRAIAELRSKSNIGVAAAPTPGPRRIYLHARAEHVPVRDQVKNILRGDGIEPLTPVIDPARDLSDMTRESRVRIETAMRCDALALVRGDGDERFVGDLIDIGIRERERMQIARGVPLPCAVLDRSGQSLPIDVSGYEIERFDLSSDNWRGEFRGWLDKSRVRPAAEL
jgi:hypothetical protein